MPQLPLCINWRLKSAIAPYPGKTLTNLVASKLVLLPRANKSGGPIIIEIAQLKDSHKWLRYCLGLRSLKGSIAALFISTAVLVVVGLKRCRACRHY